ncbi:hypothetical protein LMG28688_07229 [Paraburkholderia caffeinitolerans]|uniref:DDE domain-containing protein n=1 Tax=Paraburkholderia caffeinitolerans TaxID=1723730 RepID=A0A6J5H4G2_9BURK|nr:hypothetical protein LMG28688_07229 [Paraburkholderia caffeinitolerans]
MLGLKRFRSAATTISCIELAHRIRKGQFDLAKRGLKSAAAPNVWMLSCPLDKVSCL